MGTFNSIQALNEASGARSASTTPTHGAAPSPSPEPTFELELPCEASEIDGIIENVLVAAGILVEDAGQWELKRAASAGELFVPQVCMSPFAASLCHTHTHTHTHTQHTFPNFVHSDTASFLT